jgi:hypothetical protein
MGNGSARARRSIKSNGIRFQEKALAVNWALDVFNGEVFV